VRKFLCQTCAICLDYNCPIIDDGRSRKYRKSDTMTRRTRLLVTCVLAPRSRRAA
jgi:hypothetical protein